MKLNKVLYQLLLLLIINTTVSANNSYQLKFHYQDELQNYMKGDNKLEELPDYTTKFSYKENTISLEKLNEIVTNSLIKKETTYFFLGETRPSYTLKILVPNFFDSTTPSEFIRMLKEYIFNSHHPKEKASATVNMKVNIELKGGRIFSSKTQKKKITFKDVEYADFKDFSLSKLGEYDSKKANDNVESVSLQKQQFDISSILAGANETIEDEVTNKQFYPFVIVREKKNTHYYQLRIKISILTCIAFLSVIIYFIIRKVVKQSLKEYKLQQQKNAEKLFPKYKWG